MKKLLWLVSEWLTVGVMMAQPYVPPKPFNPNFAPYYPSEAVTAIGDSITAGANANTYTNIWWAGLNTQFGYNSNCLAYGGAVIIDQYAQLFGPMSPWSMTNSGNGTTFIGTQPTLGQGSMVVSLSGFNDMRDNGTSSSALAYFGNTLGSLIANICTPHKTLATAATATGGWTTWTNYYGGGMASKTNTDTLKFTDVVGDAVYVAYINTMQLSNDFSAISIAVDGTNYGSFNATNCLGNRYVYVPGNVFQPTYMTPNHDGALWYVPAIARIKVGTRTAHSIVVTSGGSVSHPSVVLWAAGSEQTNTVGSNGPLFIIGDTLRQVSYTSAGSDLAAGMYSEMIARQVGLYQSDGLRVRLARASAWYDPNTEISGDGVHPGPLGHTAISSAFIEAVQNAAYIGKSEQFEAAQIQTGATVGQFAAQSGTLNLANAATIRWRDLGNSIDGPYITSAGETFSIFAFNSAGNASSSFNLRRDGVPFLEMMQGGTSANGVMNQFDIQNGLFSSNGEQTLMSLQGSIAQSGTANYCLLDLQVGSGATFGSGTNYVWRFNTVNASGTPAQAYLNDQGKIQISPTAYINTVGALNTIIGSGTASSGLEVSSSGSVISKLRHGTSTLVGGTKAVSDANVTSSTRIFVTSNTDGGTPGWLRVSARSAGVSFTVTSSSGTDTSTFAYLLIEP